MAKIKYKDSDLRQEVGRKADEKFGAKNSYVKNLWILREYKKRGGKVSQTGEKPSKPEIKKLTKSTWAAVADWGSEEDTRNWDRTVEPPSEESEIQGDLDYLRQMEFDFESDASFAEEIVLFSEAKEKEKKILNKPFRLPKGSSKKFGVYVKNQKGNVVIVKFGDPNMEIRRDDPEARKNFRARHSCDTAKDKTTPRYWSCRFWDKEPVSSLAEMNDFLEYDKDLENAESIEEDGC